jgi:hypothetical protein
MTDGTLARAVFWLGIAGLLWLVFSAIFLPLHVSA